MGTAIRQCVITAGLASAGLASQPFAVPFAFGVSFLVGVAIGTLGLVVSLVVAVLR
jgi:hypothetical protein